jgi:hypothetical protein
LSRPNPQPGTFLNGLWSSRCQLGFAKTAIAKPKAVGDSNVLGVGFSIATPIPPPPPKW